MSEEADVIVEHLQKKAKLVQKIFVNQEQRKRPAKPNKSQHN